MSWRREPSNGLLSSWMSDESDPRLYHAHVARNREPILEALRRVLPPRGLVLDNRWAHRDSTMLLIAFRHGLRASELVDLRWEQVDLENAILHVRRVKQGTPATHPLTGRELRALRRLQRDRGSKWPFVFFSHPGAPLFKPGFP